MPDHHPQNGLQQEVDEAQKALLGEAQKKPGWWDPKELRDVAQNGWGGDVMMYALTDLVNQGELELGADLQVRLPESA
jgi:hypothetical protein